MVVAAVAAASVSIAVSVGIVAAVPAFFQSSLLTLVAGCAFGACAISRVFAFISLPKGLIYYTHKCNFQRWVQSTKLSFGRPSASLAPWRSMTRNDTLQALLGLYGFWLDFVITCLAFAGALGCFVRVCFQDTVCNSDFSVVLGIVCRTLMP